MMAVSSDLQCLKWKHLIRLIIDKVQSGAEKFGLEIYQFLIPILFSKCM